MTALASIATATAAGYARIRIDLGASVTVRYGTRLSKSTTGGAGQQGRLFPAEAWSATSAAQADTNALAALNGQRGLRYGFGATAGRDALGSALTFDVS